MNSSSENYIIVSVAVVEPDILHASGRAKSSQ